jgi:hypothetical protein
MDTNLIIIKAEYGILDKYIDITDKETHTCSITDAIKTNKDYNNI